MNDTAVIALYASKVTTCMAVTLLTVMSGAASAGPNGGSIVGGAGSINQSGLTTTIRQNTSSMAINWNSYNLSQNETVNYLQPDSSSISLNRITGSGASSIFGQINANDSAVLVNKLSYSKI